MQLGGAAMGGACPEYTCNIPDPHAAGWTLGTDSQGCARWQVPPGPFACGVPEAGPVCAPSSVAAYTPQPLVPPRDAIAACTSQDLSTFYQACMVGGFASAACKAYEASDAGTSCAACLVSQSTDQAWGPVVIGPTHTKLNVAGCVALVQKDASQASCAQRISDELGCEALACDAVCPVSADGGVLAYDQCLIQAASGDCRPYLDAECDPADAGITQCTGHHDDETTFVNIASVFCGGT